MFAVIFMFIRIGFEQFNYPELFMNLNLSLIIISARI